ncbi:sporulation sensor histidine kinase A [Bacillus freudenreichii]|nr:sporulation sensor histidine kinase A [Bacillus freudenreichii]
MNNGTLLQELEIYRSFIQYSDTLFSFHSINGDFTYVSPTSFPLLGYEPEELLNTCLFDFSHPDDRKKLENICFTKSYETGNYRFCKKEGDYIWLETTLIPYCHENETKGFSCISRDVTAQTATKAQLEENKEMYRLLVENFQDTVGIITKRGHWIYINNTGKKLFGVTRKEEIIGKSIFDFVYPAAYKETESQILLNRFKEPFELTVARHDGLKKYVQVKLIPTKYKERDTFQILIRDLTEQKKTEEIMHRTEKLSVVGQLAAGIAHEIRNPLTAIKGFTQLLKKEDNNDYLEVMLSELERIEDIVSDLLILAKPQPSKTEKVDIGILLKETVDLFKSEALLHDVEIMIDIEISDLFIEGEANKLKQVYINLLKNAIEAMPDGGKIQVSAIKTRSGQIVTKIIDNGIGIPDERIPNLGEPFYSTKEKGTGLGLMICNRIIKNHGGTMKIKSKVDIGTTIIILFPAFNSGKSPAIIK